MTIQSEDIVHENARCTVWLEGGPRYEGLKTAIIGSFSAEDMASGLLLLQHAIQYLEERGFEYIVGPMNGDTWHSYRFVTETDGSPPFMMEPSNPDFYPEIFEHAQFYSIGEYSSARVDTAKTQRIKPPPGDVSIRTFRPDCEDDELEKIWKLSVKAFSGNFLYTPLELDEFLELYKPLMGHILKDFVLMAENTEGELLGFLFAIPDYNQGSHPQQLIVKTYASLKRGIGGALLDQVHSQADLSGYQSIIHALMYDQNISKAHSDRFAHTFRRYTLYGRKVSI